MAVENLERRRPKERGDVLFSQWCHDVAFAEVYFTMKVEGFIFPPPEVEVFSHIILRHFIAQLHCDDCFDLVACLGMVVFWWMTGSSGVHVMAEKCGELPRSRIDDGFSTPNIKNPRATSSLLQKRSWNLLLTMPQNINQVSLHLLIVYGLEEAENLALEPNSTHECLACPFKERLTCPQCQAAAKG